MKISVLFYFFFLPFFLSAQFVDTIAVVRVVDSLVQVCQKMIVQQNLDEALHVIEIAENISEDYWGRNNADFANCLFHHGRVLFFMGQFLKAEPHFLEAKEIRERLLGKDHPDYATSLNGLGLLYVSMGQYDNAEPIYLEAKEIRGKVLGKSNPEYAVVLKNLGNLYSDIDHYDKAKSLYFEALSIFEKSVGKKSTYYTSIINDLGILYSDLGQYEKAEQLYLEYNSIKKEILGIDHPSYAIGLNNLGALYADMGQYEKAEKMYTESKIIHEKKLVINHPDYIISLINLANLYSGMGQYDKAESIYLLTLSIREKVYGRNHPDYASNLNNLGALYNDMGQYDKAKKSLLEAEKIFKKSLGTNHSEYALCLNNLGVYYRNTGQYKKSQIMYLKSMKIYKHTIREEHPEFTFCLNNIGVIYKYRGRYEKAQSIYLKSKTLFEKTIGKDHPDYTIIINNLAFIYCKTNQFYLACQYYVEANNLHRKHLNSAMHHLSESELFYFVQLFTTDQDKFYSFAGKHTSNFRQLAHIAYDNALFHKGFLLNVVSRINNLAHSDSAALQKYYLLKSYHRRLAAEYDKPIADRVGVAELEEKANVQEKELTRMVAGYGEAVRQVNWQEVRAALKTGEAAIEFVHYRFNDPDLTDSTLYAALLLRPADTTPLFIPLFEEKSLLHILDYTGSDEDYVREIYRGKIPAAFKGKEHSLYELIWKPLEPYLQNIKTIWYAPSGQLHRLAFAAIEDSAGRPISDRLRLHLLGSTRELVFRDDGKPAQINSALLFGDINYAADSTKIKEVIKKGCPSPVFNHRATELMFGAGKANKRAAIAVSPFDSLPDTRSEIMFAAKKLSGINLSPLVITGADATEESFKCHTQHGRQSPGLVVVASHGAFLPDPKRDISVRENATFRAHDNPMHRSMLVFAGADHAWTTGVGYDSLENGLLTAYEIAGLNLSNTKLVVLSACETGLGHINGAEGVYGLQRAFKIAGAQYLLMSLWRVPGKATADLMNAFYAHWLDEKKPIREAFYMAQQDMKRAGKPAYEWAGFVLFN